MRVPFYLVTSALLLAAPLLPQGGGGVQFRDYKTTGPAFKPSKACAALVGLTGYELSVYSAAMIPASATAPEHCRVDLLVQPDVNIQVNLPTVWNGRLYMFGNGGFAGESFEAAGRIANRSRGLTAGLVTAATDTGHSAQREPGGTFAVNRQKFIDFGFRSLHITAETAKRLIAAYYAEPLNKAYFDGCSTGGRQALMLAQRFPADFDGIIAGSPGLNYTGGQLARAYWKQGLAQNPFPASKLNLLAARVYDKCDAGDGLKDGLIDNPLRCDFRPARDLPLCEGANDGPSCFTSSQIAAAARLYADVPRNGKRYFPGWPLGAEIAGPNGQSGWLGQQIDTAAGQSAWNGYTSGFVRFILGPGTPLANLTDSDALLKLDIDKNYDHLAFAQQVLDATNPDLTAFRQRGGKLLMYFGWADPQLNPRMGLEYYEDVAAKMGPSTSEFARLFMVPGMFHCGGGIGTGTFDTASPLVQWVEEGKAPASIPAARILNGKTVRTRPLCPWPEVARYKGSGSIDEAANFSCRRPE
ncbi:MAG: tannase/feruloyl esterase family alpha/beta hydrolase [Terriglobia bacterium]